MEPRPDLLDARSPKGIEVFQLTGEDCPSSHVYMEAQIFTPDSRRFVLHRSAHPHGSDPHDPEHRYLLCDLDNHGELVPLTDEVGATAPSVSPDGQTLYAGTGAGSVFRYVYSDTVPAAVSVLPVPTCSVSYVCVHVAVSPVPRLPTVIVGTPVEAVVPS